MIADRGHDDHGRAFSGLSMSRPPLRMAMPCSTST
jgi:hypothetical protein